MDTLYQELLTATASSNGENVEELAARGKVIEDYMDAVYDVDVETYYRDPEETDLADVVDHFYKNCLYLCIQARMK